MAVRESDTPERFAQRVGFESLDARASGGISLLQAAVFCHHNRTVRQLLSLPCTAELLCRNEVGSSVLDVACVAGNVEAVLAILETGEINEKILSVPNVLGANSLHTTAENGHVQLVEVSFGASSRGGFLQATICTFCWQERAPQRQHELSCRRLPRSPPPPGICEYQGRKGSHTTAACRRRWSCCHRQSGAHRPLGDIEAPPRCKSGSFGLCLMAKWSA